VTHTDPYAAAVAVAIQDFRDAAEKASPHLAYVLGDNLPGVGVSLAVLAKTSPTEWAESLRYIGAQYPSLTAAEILAVAAAASDIFEGVLK